MFIFFNLNKAIKYKFFQHPLIYVIVVLQIDVVLIILTFEYLEIKPYI